MAKTGSLYTLNFPADPITNVVTPEILVQALGVQPIETLKGKTDLLLILADQDSIENCKPNFELTRGAGCNYQRSWDRY